MRLDKFESANMEPLGEGDEKKTFVNPEDESRIISERKEGVDKETPRQLKGRYYLTKIAHALLPHNIPDVHQAGESVDGKQTVDAERIAHTSEHISLQEKRRSGGDEESAGRKIVEDMGKEMGELGLELERIGLGFNIDENSSNYTKDETGNVYYLETFKPWQVDPTDQKELELLFDEESLREAIDTVSDQDVKEQCTKYLERLLILFEEDKQELQESHETNVTERGPYVEELETLVAPFMTEEMLATLNAIQTEEEARNSQERNSAKKVLSLVLKQLYFLRNETNVTDEKYDELNKKYETLSKAVGNVNRGVINHG